MIEALYEELIHLDEIAGELDPETNAKIDQRRKELKEEILALESLGSAQVDLTITNDSWYDDQTELDTDYI